MRKPEQRLWDTMKRHTPACVRLERIENGVGDGTADVHGICDGVTVWIELKVVRLPKRPDTRFFKRTALRRSQVTWHANYAAHGGRSFILVRDNVGQLYMIPGCDVSGTKDSSRAIVASSYSVSSWRAVFARAFGTPL